MLADLLSTNKNVSTLASASFASVTSTLSQLVSQGNLTRSLVSSGSAAGVTVLTQVTSASWVTPASYSLSQVYTSAPQASPTVTSATETTGTKKGVELVVILVPILVVGTSVVHPPLAEVP